MWTSCRASCSAYRLIDLFLVVFVLVVFIALNVAVALGSHDALVLARVGMREEASSAKGPASGLVLDAYAARQPSRRPHDGT